MTPRQIEMWALRVIEQVEAKQPVEDARVELKGVWPTEPNKAARRLAGHANAARGEPILWLIGVDEKKGVVGATATDPAKWFAGVQAEFDGVFPRITDLKVPWKGHLVVALLAETDRSPFVIKNPVYGQPEGGPVAREVPWREGTAVRSATRADLLRLLTPQARLPDVEWLGAALWASHITTPRQFLAWRLDLYLYITPLSDEPVVIPGHRCELWFEMEGKMSRITLGRPTFGSDSPRNTSSRSGVVISSPGLVTASPIGESSTPLPAFDPVRIGGRLCPVRSEAAITFDKELRLVPGRQDYVGLWAEGLYDCW
jgi:hypothetical protein